MIVLVGFMGAGKTSVGRLLAERIALPFVDTDEVIERQHGPILNLFEKFGEAGFRSIESAVISSSLVGPDAVVALGGGAVETPAVRAALHCLPVLWLQVSLAEALTRLGTDSSRPVLNSPDLAQRFQDRQKLYRAVATATIDVDGLSLADVVDAVCEER